MQDKENEVCITSLTKDEYDVLSMIFDMGVSSFISQIDEFKDNCNNKLLFVLLRRYQTDRLNTIKSLADKFNFDF